MMTQIYEKLLSPISVGYIEVDDFEFEKKLVWLTLGLGLTYLIRHPIFSTSSELTLGTLKHSLNRGESTCCTFVLYFRFDGNISIRT